MGWPMSQSDRVGEVSAAEALRISKEKLDVDRQRWGEINSLANVLRKHRLANHFSERISRGWEDTR